MYASVNEVRGYEAKVKRPAVAREWLEPPIRIENCGG